MWQCGNVEMWKCGNVETWKRGNVEMWKCGILELIMFKLMIAFCWRRTRGNPKRRLPAHSPNNHPWPKYIRIGLRFVLWLWQMLQGILKKWVLQGGVPYIYIYIFTLNPKPQTLNPKPIYIYIYSSTHSEGPKRQSH